MEALEGEQWEEGHTAGPRPPPPPPPLLLLQQGQPRGGRADTTPLSTRTKKEATTGGPGRFCWTAGRTSLETAPRHSQAGPAFLGRLRLVAPAPERDPRDQRLGRVGRRLSQGHSATKRRVSLAPARVLPRWECPGARPKRRQGWRCRECPLNPASDLGVWEPGAPPPCRPQGGHLTPFQAVSRGGQDRAPLGWVSPLSAFLASPPARAPLSGGRRRAREKEEEAGSGSHWYARPCLSPSEAQPFCMAL